MIALSTAEIELIALSEATCFIQSLSYLINELHEKGMVTIPTPQIFCRIFKDNEAALEISKVPKDRPRTRHINVTYHHFRPEVFNKRIKIQPIRLTSTQRMVTTHFAYLYYLEMPEYYKMLSYCLCATAHIFPYFQITADTTKLHVIYIIVYYFRIYISTWILFNKKTFSIA
jgi:hypothetical protein